MLRTTRGSDSKAFHLARFCSGLITVLGDVGHVGGNFSHVVFVIGLFVAESSRLAKTPRVNVAILGDGIALALATSNRCEFDIQVVIRDGHRYWSQLLVAGFVVVRCTDLAGILSSTGVDLSALQVQPQTVELTGGDLYDVFAL